MKKIKELISEKEILQIVGDFELFVSAIHFDSRQVTPNSLFVAIKGVDKDGGEFIESALEKGATAIICETMPLNTKSGITYIAVKDSHEALAQIAQNFYDNPSQKIKLVGVTGTNGKTTTVTLLFNLFRELGFHTALLSTIENKIDDEVFPATHTTPDPVQLASFLSQAVKRGCQYAFMECSSHAIHQKRTFGLRFALAIFTNLTHDHLDYHKTLEAYADAKKELFDELESETFALANSDDEKAEYVLSSTKARKYFFSLNNPSADFYGQTVSQSLSGSILSINQKIVKTKLAGKFNTYNTLGVFGTTLLLGIEEKKIIDSLAKLSPPKGRLEFIKSPSDIYAVVDYAHSPDALENVLKMLSELKTGKTKIITVVGCGGDRDKTKRPVMGEIAVRFSDYVFFTSDNPRSEDPEKILRDITENLNGKNYECVVDRTLAISKACSFAQSGDMVLVAGKGHETYQIFDGKTLHFSDQEEIMKNFTLITK